MKKLIIILALFTSCGYAKVDNRMLVIVTHLESTDNTWTYYYGRGTHTATIIQSYCIIDSADKYSVGDTIKLTK